MYTKTKKIHILSLRHILHRQLRRSHVFFVFLKKRTSSALSRKFKAQQLSLESQHELGVAKKNLAKNSLLGLKKQKQKKTQLELSCQYNKKKYEIKTLEIFTDIVNVSTD